MNILERQIIWEAFRIHFPMLICAFWVINEQKKIIWNTLKVWWSWKDLKVWTKERVKYSLLYLFAVGCFIFCLFTANWRAKLVEKQQQQTVEKTLEEKVITEEQLKKVHQEIERTTKKITNKNSLPLYNVSPFLCFILVCIVAPLGEECVFRYLVFKIFNKKNPLTYLFSGTGFIFMHWAGPVSGILNLTTLSFLLLTYLPMTIVFILSYKVTNWNLTYPLFFHFLWNFITFCLAASSSFSR